jgi:hypothetical protein
VVRRLFKQPPPEFKTHGYNPDLQNWLDVGVAQLKIDHPAAAWLVAQATPRVETLGMDGPTRVDYEHGRIALSWEDAGLEPERLAVFLLRRAVLGFRARLKEPSDGHRGWEAALLDTYDLCGLAKMDGVDPEGLRTVEQYLAKTLRRRPWEAE